MIYRYWLVRNLYQYFFFCYVFLYVEYKTNVSRNSNMSKLQAGYLFPEVCSYLFQLYWYKAETFLIWYMNHISKSCSYALPNANRLQEEGLRTCWNTQTHKSLVLESVIQLSQFQKSSLLQWQRYLLFWRNCSGLLYSRRRVISRD